MEDLIKKYNISVKSLLLMCMLDEWTWREMDDLEYIEARIIIHLDVK